MLYEFMYQIAILIHYIFWKYTSFCKWDENFSVKLYISEHRLRLQTSVPSVHCLLLLKSIY